MSLAKGLSIFVVFKKKQDFDSLISFFLLFFILYFRGPQLLSHKPVRVHGLFGTRLPSRRWAMGERAKFHIYLQLLPLIVHITAWALPSVRSVAALDSHRRMNPTVNFTAHAFYENLILMIWSGAEAVSAREWLQIQVMLAERFNCTETICLQTRIKTWSVSAKWQLYNFKLYKLYITM